MTGCYTCGGFGGHHDPVAHDQHENDEPCVCDTDFTCLADEHELSAPPAKEHP